MYKSIACVFIYLCMMLPTVSSAEALKKYSIHQQDSRSPSQQTKKLRSNHIREDVYERFKEKIENYSPTDKAKLAKHIRAQIEKSRSEKNKKAKAHYQRLLGIIHTNN